ncbi:hypothetical protein TRICHSKD4_3692 [Roseibium sp. TrichSKD4]|uniref:hypothetical protein n=1 Tax=Roseibium sp. TrichSKD4 TaxID=744980 RepID=UPI0001E56B49|nr:hypothetical protein [Roseibium sp. TrichSKD4]EFO30117.1 hypothetical protein TRICHSKD4_3692 [Roseibium sp. TrichSKD4]
MPEYTFSVAADSRNYFDVQIVAANPDEAKRMLQTELAESSNLHVFSVESAGVKQEVGEDLALNNDPITKDYTTLEMEAALCVWEWINEVTLLDHETKSPEWITLRENLGSIELRHKSMDLGKWCLKVFDICTKDDQDIFEGHPYDFEVIPAIMSFVEVETHDYTTPAPEQVAPKLLKKLGIHVPETGPGYWKETPEKDLDFFQERAANEGFFRNYEAVSLRLTKDTISSLLVAMDKCQAMFSSGDHIFVETTFLDKVAPDMEVITADSDPEFDMNFRHSSTNTIIRCSSSGASVIFQANDMHTADCIVTEELSVRQLQDLYRQLS